MTERMRAISQRVFGGPEVLEQVEVDRPEPGPGEVLVRVRAAGVNAADWKLRSGALRKLGEPPFTLGLDVSGVAEKLGAGVEDFQPGDEVFGIVLSRSGSYAEFVVAPAVALALIPPSLDHVKSAALPSAASTAWQALAGIQPAQRVLIHAAAGGVGHLAVQIAKARGAIVIGTARAAKHAFLRDLGADELVDYTAVDFAEAVSDVDVVLDLVGEGYAARSLKTLKPGGLLIDAVGGAQELDQADVEAQGFEFVRFYVSQSGNDLEKITELVETGALSVVIDHVLPLEQAAKAHELIESQRVSGKIVLTVG
jgi:NADPH:quinone reductase-like Zn-dependent oxidoreductase